MQLEHPETRLSSLWGFIDRQHNDEIIARVQGKHILDVGCGYGSLVAQLKRQHFEAVGVDPDPISIAAAKRLFPAIDVRAARAENLDSTYDGMFDSITLKDCLHHLIGEGEAEEAFISFRRLLRPNGRLVVLDPNPNGILRVARRLASFHDFQTPLEEAQQTLVRHGFRIRAISYYEVVGLPLSGGYVYREFVPQLRALHVLVAAANRGLSRLATAARLGPIACWRYVIVADLRAPRS